MAGRTWVLTRFAEKIEGGRSISEKIILASIVAVVLFMPVSIGIDAQPDSASSWNEKGTSLFNQGKYSEALQAFDKAIEHDPNFPEIWYNKGNALYSQGKYDDAIKAYDKVLELDSQYAYAWLAKGKALNILKKYEEAIQALDNVVELNPKDAEAWSVKGSALKALNLSTMANEAFDKAIECDPNSALAWYNKGLVLNSLGKKKEAETAFAKAKELGYTFPRTEIIATTTSYQSGQSTKSEPKLLSEYQPKDYQPTVQSTKPEVKYIGYQPRNFVPPSNPNAF